MAYGSVEGTMSLKGSLMYVSEGEPHSDKHVNERNLAAWTNKIPTDDAPLYERMKRVIDLYPNKRRKHESYSYVISYGRDEFDVDDPDDVLAMQDHVRQTCDHHFGENVPYVVHIQGDGEGGMLHAHILALNVDLETGKTIHDKTGVYQWRASMNAVTRKRDELNKALEFPEKNAKVIPKSTAPRKPQTNPRDAWRDQLMDKVDTIVSRTVAPTFDGLVQEFADNHIHLSYEEREVKGKSMMTASYAYSPPEGVESNGKVRAERKVKASRLGTDYMFDGLLQRYKQREQELLARAIEKESKRELHAKKARGFVFGGKDKKPKHDIYREDVSAGYNTGEVFDIDEQDEVVERHETPKNAADEVLAVPVELTQEQKEEKRQRELMKRFVDRETQHSQSSQKGTQKSDHTLDFF